MSKRKNRSSLTLSWTISCLAHHRKAPTPTIATSTARSWMWKGINFIRDIILHADVRVKNKNDYIRNKNSIKLPVFFFRNVKELRFVRRTPNQLLNEREYPNGNNCIQNPTKLPLAVAPSSFPPPPPPPLNPNPWLNLTTTSLFIFFFFFSFFFSNWYLNALFSLMTKMNEFFLQ